MEGSKILENLKHNVMTVFVSTPCHIPANCMSICAILYSECCNMQCIWAQDHDMELCFILMGTLCWS